MLDYKDALAEVHAVLQRLEDAGHEFASRLRGAYDALMGEVTADAEQVVYDAEAAAAPVVAEATKDAENVAKDAVTDAEQAATTN